MTSNQSTQAQAPDLTNDLFEFLDGKEYTLDGVHGHFRYNVTHLRRSDRYEHTLEHIPSEQGKESDEYWDIRQQLGDAWTTDLTNSIERYCAIALELGYEYKPDPEPEAEPAPTRKISESTKRHAIAYFYRQHPARLRSCRCNCHRSRR